MFCYRVVVGTASADADGVPYYSFRVEEKQKSLGEPRPDSLEAVLNHLAAEGWEPYQFFLPTSYVVFRDKPQEAPVTLVFRREESSSI